MSPSQRVQPTNPRWTREYSFEAASRLIYDPDREEAVIRNVQDATLEAP